MKKKQPPKLPLHVTTNPHYQGIARNTTVELKSKAVGTLNLRRLEMATRDWPFDTKRKVGFV